MTSDVTQPNSSADVERVIELARDAISAVEIAAHPLHSYMRRDAQVACEELFAAIRALAGKSL